MSFFLPSPIHWIDAGLKKLNVDGTGISIDLDVLFLTELFVLILITIGEISWHWYVSGITPVDNISLLTPYTVIDSLLFVLVLDMFCVNLLSLCSFFSDRPSCVWSLLSVFGCGLVVTSLGRRENLNLVVVCVVCVVCSTRSRSGSSRLSQVGLVLVSVCWTYLP